MIVEIINEIRQERIQIKVDDINSLKLSKASDRNKYDYYVEIRYGNCYYPISHNDNQKLQKLYNIFNQLFVGPELGSYQHVIIQVSEVNENELNVELIDKRE